MSLGFRVLALVTVATAPVAAQPFTAEDVRTVLNERVGSIEALRVPDLDTDLPQPTLEGGGIDPRFELTEAKRYLGKFLFHDPIRSNRVLPEFGGDEEFSQTASCGSCHFGEAGSKAGQVLNFGVGGQGRMTMQTDGTFVVERVQIDGTTDTVPTPLVVRDEEGDILLDGRADQVDSVPRLSPSVVGFAYNNRLLWDGVAGEPFDAANDAKANLNPDDLPAGESLSQIANLGHRMANTAQKALQQNAVYRELFRRAFPDEYAAFEDSGDIDDYINEDTIIRAMAAYMRSVVTRNTPWDRFLAGDNEALTERQLHGAFLFAANVGAGGADCISCHSGPALNKQLGDEAGVLVEENFDNLGLNDHPLQELVREALGNPDHHDRGRQDATANPADAYQFKSPTLRQLRGTGPVGHSGEFETVREFIEYLNAGVPAADFAAEAGNLSPRFTNPRGPGTTGLGLSVEEIDALDDFIVNGLFDIGFIVHDPDSPTKTFDPNIEDLTYDEDLEALGAVDGMLPSNMAVGNDDDMTREQTLFVRGRINDDETIDLADAVFLLNHLFLGGPEPTPLAAADVDYNHKVELTDGIYLLSFLFLGGKEPPMPYPNLGQLVQ